MSKEEQIDQKIVNHLIELEKKPYLYFGDNITIDRLESFLFGLNMCYIDFTGTPSKVLSDFNCYVAEYYNDNMSLNACGYVRYKQGSSQEAFQAFFELFHLFLNQSGQSGDGSKPLKK